MACLHNNISILSLIAFILIVMLTPSITQAAYDKPYIGETIEYDAKYEDTFVHLARDYGLGYVEMRAANPGIDPWIPGSGRDLVLPARHLLPEAPRKGIVINLPEMRLYAFVNGSKAPETYPLGIGREGLETPVGSTSIVRKAEGPTWRPTERMRREDPELPALVGPGPENPMGTHALYLGWPLYAIHGTNRPFGIGRRVSSGCIRLYPEDIRELFSKIPVGTKVTVVDQPIKLAWIENNLYLEAHPSVEQSITMEQDGFLETPQLSEKELSSIIKMAGEHEERLNWSTIRRAVKERKGYPIKIASRPLIQKAALSAEGGDAKIDKPDQKLVVKPEKIKEIRKKHRIDDLKTRASVYDPKSKDEEPLASADHDKDEDPRVDAVIGLIEGRNEGFSLNQ